MNGARAEIAVNNFVNISFDTIHKCVLFRESQIEGGFNPVGV